VPQGAGELLGGVEPFMANAEAAQQPGDLVVRLITGRLLQRLKQAQVDAERVGGAEVPHPVGQGEQLAVVGMPRGGLPGGIDLAVEQDIDEYAGGLPEPGDEAAAAADCPQPLQGGCTLVLQWPQDRATDRRR
jgi:hypothetical protein